MAAANARDNMDRGTGTPIALSEVDVDTIPSHLGVDDLPPCPLSGYAMSLTRRGPHPDDEDYELQTFACECGHRIERSVDMHGEPLK